VCSSDLFRSLLVWRLPKPSYSDGIRRSEGKKSDAYQQEAIHSSTSHDPSDAKFSK